MNDSREWRAPARRTLNMNALCPASSLNASSIAACAEAAFSAPANDNAGAKWHAADSAPHTDDRRSGVEVALVTARRIAPTVETFAPSWRVDFSSWPRASVSIRPREAYCNGTARRVSTLREMLRAAGFETWGV